MGRAGEVRVSGYADPESYFVGDRSDHWQGSGYFTLVWRFYVVVRWDEQRYAMMIDVWNPRYECTDADEETGAPIYDWEYDRLSSALIGHELTDWEHDTFSDAVREMLREMDVSD